jgi:hypothetical protein
MMTYRVGVRRTAANVANSGFVGWGNEMPHSGHDEVSLLRISSADPGRYNMA